MAYSLLYAHRRMGGLVVPKCLAFLLVAAIPPVLFVMGVIPADVKAQKLACVFGEEGARLVPDGFEALRSEKTGRAILMERPLSNLKKLVKPYSCPF